MKRVRDSIQVHKLHCASWPPTRPEVALQRFCLSDWNAATGRAGGGALGPILEAPWLSLLFNHEGKIRRVEFSGNILTPGWRRRAILVEKAWRTKISLPAPEYHAVSHRISIRVLLFVSTVHTRDPEWASEQGVCRQKLNTDPFKMESTTVMTWLLSQTPSLRLHPFS